MAIRVLMSVAKRLVLILLVFFASCKADEKEKAPDFLAWTALPPFPGLQLPAGHFSGVHNDVLMIAGGNDAERKIWYDSIHVLEKNGQWLRSGIILPRPLAYGCAVSTSDGIMCIGGADSTGYHQGVFLLRWNKQTRSVELDTMPSLPVTLAYCTAVLAGNTIFVAGGKRSPDSTNSFYAFDLSKKSWEQLAAWPGPGRIMPAMAAQSNGENNCIYLFSGSNTGAYCYNPITKEWKKIAGLALKQEGPAPAAAFGLNHILVFSGAGVMAYHTITDQWIKAGELPGRIASQAVCWGNDIIITGDEVRKASPATQVSQALSLADFVLIALYFSGVIFIVGRHRKKNKNTNDFYKAGGRIPGWASGVAIFGTLLSSITFLTTPAKTYSGDWMFFLPSINTLIVAPLIVFAILPVYRRLDITTAYEYLEKRFDKTLRMLGSLSFLLFRSAKIGVILLLPSLAIAAVTDISVITCITIVGLFSTFYCVVGGIEAVVWTEVLQVFVLLLGAIVSLVVIFFQLDGGLHQMITMAEKANKLSFIRWELNVNDLTFLVMIAYWIGGGLVPYTSDQAIIQKYLTTKDEKSAARGVWTNAALVVASSLLFFAIGTALFAFYNQYPQKLNPQLASSEAVFPWFIVNELPTGIRGLVTAGVFAAAMSSLNSSMNSMSAAVVTDYREWKKDLSAKRALLLAKVFTAFFGLLGTAMALFMFIWEVGSLWDLIRKLTGLLTGGLAGLFILGIFTTRANARGALIGLMGSSIIQYYISNFSKLHFMVYSFTGIASCFVIGYLASFLFSSSAKNLDGLTVFTLRKRDGTIKVISDNESLIASKQ